MPLGSYSMFTMVTVTSPPSMLRLVLESKHSNVLSGAHFQMLQMHCAADPESSHAHDGILERVSNNQLQ